MSAVGCSNEADPPPLYGTPTQLIENEDPLAAICRIQKEAFDLPTPLMESIGYQQPWVSRNFGAATVKHDGYHTVQLTQTGLSFIETHSRLELVTSLTPLFGVASKGGEAAVLLAGIPAGNKSIQKGKTARIANALREARYRKPESPGKWFDNVENYYSRVNTLTGLGNQTESIHQRKPEKLESSLEAKIINVLYDYGRIPIKIIEEWPHMPQPHNESRVTSWIQSNDAPLINNKVQQFINSHPKNFSALVLFPYLPEARKSTLSRDEILIMYLLGIEDKYWPAIMQLSSSMEIINELRSAFRKEVVKIIVQSCTDTEGNKLN